MKDITTLVEILDTQYGKRRTKTREIWEQKFETFIF